jgi:hypothetical protein
MEKRTPSEHLLDMVPLWMKIAIVALCAFSAIVGIWRHVITRWDFLYLVGVLGLFFFPAGVTEPLGRNLRWPLRVIFVLWVIAFSALFVHFWGWVPGLGFAALNLFHPDWNKSGSWKADLRKPLDIIFAVLMVILTIWFARTTGGWVPTACVVATFFLLEGYSTDGRSFARRTLGDNLRRPSSAAIAAIAIFAAVWAWLYRSFGNVAGLVIVIVLFSSDVYLHTEERPSLHTSHSGN